MNQHLQMLLIGIYKKKSRMTLLPKERILLLINIINFFDIGKVK